MSLFSLLDNLIFQEKKGVYRYEKKEHVMTESERKFFNLLLEAVGDKYHIFPQAHLSSFLNHKIKGQSWLGAFSHINGKSVDYLLCDKTSLTPMIAVELDDKSHERRDRMERDIEVNRIFDDAKLHLGRIKVGKIEDAGELRRYLEEIESLPFSEKTEDSTKSLIGTVIPLVALLILATMLVFWIVGAYSDIFQF